LKVLFINKYDLQGGAAIAAWRLKNGLAAQYNADVKFLVALKRTSDNNVTVLRRNEFENFVQKGWNFVTSLLGLQYLWFPVTAQRILNFAQQQRPDVIHLHNIHGGYFEINLLKKLSAIAPIVWTMHDMWPFMANAAHAFGDDSWKNMSTGVKEWKCYPALLGIRSGKFLLRHKKKLYQKSRITFVGPSLWLTNLAKQSPALCDNSILQIFNGIDTNLFVPALDKKEAKALFDIPENARTLMFSADRILTSQYKGASDLIEVVRYLNYNSKQTIYLLLVGSKPEKDPLSEYANIKAVYTGYIREEAKMIACYQAADIFIYPTKADNLPNTLVEAIACGVPCITSNIGGCPEIIQDNDNGFIVNNNTELAQKAELLLNSPNLLTDFSQNARRKAENDFSLEKYTSAYYMLYQSLILPQA
jgi:glycosyltransferase involved in cell wall biosynthesis